MLARRPLRWPWFVLACGSGCAAGAEPRAEIVLPPSVSAPLPFSPPVPPVPVVVRVVAAPPRVIVDGNLTEWTAPAEAHAWVMVAFTPDGAYVAASLDPDAPDPVARAEARGLWLGIGSDPLEPGPNGPPCGVPTNAQEEEVCEGMARERAAWLARYAALFRRLFRIDATGMRVASEGATVAQAKVAWRTRADGGANVEAWIPASGLPRLDQAPFATVRLFARPSAGGPPPPYVEKEWTDVAVEPPVGFGHAAELRAKVFEAIQNRYCDDRLSYQPGDDEHLIGAWSGAGPQYTKQTSLGDAEVGFVLENPMICHATGANGPDTELTLVAILHRGKVLEVRQLGRVVAIVPRAGALHIIDFRSGYSDGEGFDYAEWRVAAVGADGTIRDDLMIPARKPAYTTGKRSMGPEHHVADLTSFGAHGVMIDRDPQTGQEILRRLDLTWRWDARAKAYIGQEKRVAGPSPSP